jgi:type VI secretion system protein
MNSLPGWLRQKQPAATLVIALCLLMCFGSACRVGRKTPVLCVRTGIAPLANQNSPIPVDLVLVRDKDLLKEISKLSAADWGQRREQYRRDYPDKKQLVDYRWEWVPGQQIPCFTVPFTPKPKATYIFAGYLSKGDHRARVASHKGIQLKLLPDDFEVSPGESCSPKTCPLSVQ